VTAVLGLVVSTTMTPVPGVKPDNVGGIVQVVEPGSPTWRDGIREGDEVTDLDSAAGTWYLTTTSQTDGVPHTSTKESQTQGLRSTVPFAVIGLILAAFSALLAHRGHQAAAVILPIAILLAAQPFFFAGFPAGSIAAGVVLFAGSALAAVSFGRWRPVLVVPLVVGVVLAAAWVASIVAVPAAFATIDTTRVPMAIGFGVIGFAAVGDRRRIRDFMAGRTAPAAADLVYLGSAVALVVAGILGAFLIPAVLVAVVALLIYPFWRTATISTFDRLIASQARRDASIRAVEDERGRLAREIHDSPLQDLSGVIRRLESLPGAEGEADALRAVAGQLRDVATSLHPPVLVDLGLAAAIEDLRDQLCAAAPAWQIDIDVDDLTTAGRPPQDVELAAFRVTQEAMANAIAHSGGQCLEVRGSVAPEVIDLAIRDDGHGLREHDARAARRSGHFGLDSIRERAIAAGGTSTLTTSPEGVSVRFRWESRS
jgi:signal transduction histidine kinase